MHFLFNRLTYIRLELDFLDEDFLCWLAEGQCIYTCTWWTDEPRVRTPPPPDVPWWVGQGPCGCYYLIFSFISCSICSSVVNIRVITNIAGFYGKTLFSFILFIVARFSTKIKHFLGEDGYILYKIDWKSANITLKNIPLDDPLDPVPPPTTFTVLKHIHCVCSSPSRRRHAFTPRRRWIINVAFKG